MALVFCTKCEKILDDRSLLPKLNRICPYCRNSLFYFGREEVVLSAQEIIIEYDKTHRFDPIGDLTGKVETVYQKQTLDLDIIECEDSIIHDEDNIDARQYLARLYYSRFEFTKAVTYFLEILKIDSVNTNAISGMADVLICKKDYTKALEYLLKLNKDEMTESMHENLGIVFVHLNKINKGINCFLKAYKLSKSAEKKASLKKLVSQLISLKS
jgi:tetratricopeptide (TPR) repeat protein